MLVHMLIVFMSLLVACGSVEPSSALGASPMRQSSDALVQAENALPASEDPWLLNPALLADTSEVALDGAEPPDTAIITPTASARAAELYTEAERTFAECPRCLIELRGGPSMDRVHLYVEGLSPKADAKKLDISQTIATDPAYAPDCKSIVFAAGDFW
jgi:hypothetical protein